MYLTHVTRDGERWDLIAWQYYRDVSKMPRLIEANPHVPIVEILTGGIELSIPVIDVAGDSQEELPPWER